MSDSPHITALFAVLDLVPFYGWTQQVIDKSLENDPVVKQAFPTGVVDAVRAFQQFIQQQQEEKAAALALKEMKTPARIRALLVARLEILAPYKEAVRALMSYYMQPAHVAEGVKALSATANHLWYLAGDSTTDFSYYTRRMTLSGLYSSTLLFWLNDTSDNSAETIAFMDRRLKNIGDFHQSRTRWQKELSSKFSQLCKAI